MRHQRRANKALGNGTAWHLGLHDCLTASAGQTRADDLVHDVVARNILQLFHDISAQLLEAAATVSADITGRDPLFYPLEIFGEGFALAWGARRLGLLFSGWRVFTYLCGLRDLMFFEHQLQCKLIKALRARSKAVLLMPVQLQAQIGNDRVAGLNGLRMGGAFCNQFRCLCCDVGLHIGGQISQI